MKIERILESNLASARKRTRADVGGHELPAETDTSDAVVFHHEDPRNQQQNQGQEQPASQDKEEEKLPQPKYPTPVAAGVQSERVDVVA